MRRSCAGMLRHDHPSEICRAGRLFKYMYESRTFWKFSVKKFGSWREIKGKEKNRGQSKDSAELIFLYPMQFGNRAHFGCYFFRLLLSLNYKRISVAFSLLALWSYRNTFIISIYI